MLSKFVRSLFFYVLNVLCVLCVFVSNSSLSATELPTEWLKPLTWRCIGPANMGGRITALAVFEADPTTYWVATASGGLLKTTNNGVTFEHQFDREATVSIGDVCVAQSDKNIVWVGSGEGNPRNSVSYGDGVYKSTDGGKSWQNMGLKKSFQIGRILIHPKNPDIVYVGALGRLYGPNEERGLFKTSDGGKTWERILYVDDQTGVIDLRMNPADPETLLAATYERQRDGYDVNDPAKKFGAGSGLYRTSDGGKSWQKISKGLPTCKLGRLGIDWSRKDPNLVFLLVESEKIGGSPHPLAENGSNGGKLPYLDRLGGQAANVQDKQGPEGYECGGVFKSTDGGLSWARLNSLNPRPMYFSQIRIDPNDDNYVYVLGISLYRSRDGGRTFDDEGGHGAHGDHHALWIDPRDGRHMILGNDGGFYVTYDRTANWDRLNHMALGQFYHVAVDTCRNYRVYGGLQDNGTWGGPSRTHSAIGPINEDWIRIGGGDGFRCAIDPSDPDLVYSTAQRGALRRLHLRTGESAAIRPPNTRRYRFNWNTPFRLSHHNPRIFYCAGNVVFRSLDRGNDLRVISPDITATNRGSASALAESPRNPDVLYVGSDDGYLWVTRNGGREWTNITQNVWNKERAGGVSDGQDPSATHASGSYRRWVASIEPSRFAEGRAYVVFDGHRSDDDEPYVYVTEDFGKTWKSLRGNLPWGSTRVLREDIDNADLLYLGTEFGAWYTLDRGQTWNRLNTNLPTVAVHEFAIHPTAGEIVAATHGRSLWILDVTALRQLTPQALQAEARLYRPATAVRWRMEPSRGQTNRRFIGENPPFGATIWYSLGKKAEKASLKVLDIEGQVVRELKAETQPGLHKIVWDLTRAPERPRRGQQSPQSGPPATPGSYLLVLTVDGNEYKQALRVEEEQ